MPRIFICYRRSDSIAVVGRIVDRLLNHYGQDDVHCDILNPPLTVDFRTHIRTALLSTDVVVVVIGPSWANRDETGSPALQNKNHPVRIEIETAMQLGIVIVPILIGSARMPTTDQLPAEIANLAYLNAATIDPGRDFGMHMDRLMHTLDNIKQMKDYVRSAGGPAQAARTGSDAIIDAGQEPVSAVQRLATEETPQAVGRNTPEYWLRRVAVERRLAPAGEPLILMSFASEDQTWIDEARAFLDPRLEQLRDPNGQPYQLWNFSDSKRGTTPGDEFPEVVAEKMWRCRVALLVLSRDYFRSQYCRQIELPFLMWRREFQGLMCMPLRLGALPVDGMRLPKYEGPSRNIVFDEMVDDRQAPKEFAKSAYRDFSLKQLKEMRIETEIELRFQGVARLIAEHLKAKYAAVDYD